MSITDEQLEQWADEMETAVDELQSQVSQYFMNGIEHENLSDIDILMGNISGRLADIHDEREEAQFEDKDNG